ncbi:MAG: hypothetical protein M3N47_07605 [Chloroflexota bacterium]|nr:hypothetical protein [Chloroflexota bacterium]
MARAAATALAIGLLLAAAGCGGGSDEPAARTTGDDLGGLDRRSVDTATRAQIERFAMVRIPASATNLRSSWRDAMDTQLLVSFRLPREDLAEFVRSGNFRGKLTEGDRAIASSVGSELGWRLGEAERVAGLSDTRSGLGRNLVVVLDDPRRPVVHLQAATL